MKSLTLTLNEERRVTLTVYRQAVGGEFAPLEQRPAVLILPGGAYRFCSDREADPVAFAFLRAGFQALILRYSVGEHKTWQHPLEDYEQAMATIAENAAEWGIDTKRIAVVGFSAGGHLAGCAATLAQHKPAAAILGYPVLNRRTAEAYLPDAPDVIEAVDENTCPCFLFSARTDTTVPVTNTLEMLQALERHGVPYEAHIYGFGPHGFSVADSTVNNRQLPMSAATPHWVADSLQWLREQADF